jgi:signal transduction histidine kinase
MHPREQFPGKIYELLLETEKSTKALFGLLENLLQWANLQMGRHQFEFCTFSLQEAVERGTELFRSLSTHKNISLEWRGNFDVMVHTDPEALYTILRNIITNAIKYSPENSPVEISRKDSTQNQVIICVRDQGAGMNPTQIANLFRPEAKQSVVGTKGEKGSGIGLILCHELAENTGMKIEVESQPGQGCRFYIYIPAANKSS